MSIVSESSIPISVDTIDTPYNQNAESLEELKTKVDELMVTINEQQAFFEAQSEELNTQTAELTEIIERAVSEEGRKIRIALAKLIRMEIAAALAPHRRLVPSVQPRVPETAVDLTGDTTEEEDEETETEDEIPLAQKSKRTRYIEH